MDSKAQDPADCSLYAECQKTLHSKWAKQEATNSRLGEKLDKVEAKISDIQAHGFGLQALIAKQGEEFKEERLQTRQAVHAVATALANSDVLQAARHEKTLELQQKNLEANMDLLAIFQGHEAAAEAERKILEKKICANRISHKALTGLGLLVLASATGFVFSMASGRFDSAVHSAAKAFLNAFPIHL